MRKLVVLLALLGGCLCDGDRYEQAAYVPVRAEPKRVAACVEGRDCQPLCTRVFGLDDSVRISRCEVVERRYDPQATPIAARPMEGLIGVALEVTFYDQVPCDDGDDGWDDDDWGSDDDDWDPCSDGSCDDPGDDGDDWDWLQAAPRA